MKRGLLACVAAVMFLTSLCSCGTLRWEDDQSATSGEKKSLEIQGLFKRAPCKRPEKADK